MKRVYINAHCALRILERGLKFGLDYFETKKRVFQTLKEGKLSKKKHRTVGKKTYVKYFKDNLCFYLICKEKRGKVLIKTIIIEKGRE